MKELNQTQAQIVAGGINFTNTLAANYNDLQGGGRVVTGIGIVVGIEVDSIPAPAVLRY